MPKHVLAVEIHPFSLQLSLRQVLTVLVQFQVKSGSSVKSRSSSVPAARRSQPTFSAPRPPAGTNIIKFCCNYVSKVKCFCCVLGKNTSMEPCSLVSYVRVCCNQKLKFKITVGVRISNPDASKIGAF